MQLKIRAILQISRRGRSSHAPGRTLLWDYAGQAPGFHCAESHSRSVSSLVLASCSRAKSASVLVRTSV